MPSEGLVGPYRAGIAVNSVQLRLSFNSCFVFIGFGGPDGGFGGPNGGKQLKCIGKHSKH